jgi:hypothetical protein
MASIGLSFPALSMTLRIRSGRRYWIEFRLFLMDKIIIIVYFLIYSLQLGMNLPKELS